MGGCICPSHFQNRSLGGLPTRVAGLKTIGASLANARSEKSEAWIRRCLRFLKKLAIVRLAWARVAELADAPDLGSGVFGHRGSSPLSRTIKEVFPLKIILKKTPFSSAQKPPPLSRQNASQTRKFAETANCVGTTNSRLFARQFLNRIHLAAVRLFVIPQFPSPKNDCQSWNVKTSFRQQQSKDSPCLDIQPPEPGQ